MKRAKIKRPTGTDHLNDCKSHCPVLKSAVWNMKLTMINALITIDIIFIIASFVSHWCEIAPEHARTKKNGGGRRTRRRRRRRRRKRRKKETNKHKKKKMDRLASLTDKMTMNVSGRSDACDDATDARQGVGRGSGAGWWTLTGGLIFSIYIFCFLLCAFVCLFVSICMERLRNRHVMETDWIRPLHSFDIWSSLSRMMANTPTVLSISAYGGALELCFSYAVLQIVIVVIITICFRF